MDIDIDLYIDSVYNGFFPIEDIEERIEEFRELAEEAAKDANDDEIIVYAVFKYEQDSEKIVYANLMTEKLTYQEYVEICQSDDEYKRYFFIKKNRENTNEKN